MRKHPRDLLSGCLADARQDNEGLKELLRADLSSHPDGGKHPKDLLVLWEDTTLTLGRTRWGGKGLLRGESSSVYPESAKADEGSSTILGGCLATSRQDKVEREDALL
jgi:hypothetical protein